MKESCYFCLKYRGFREMQQTMLSTGGWFLRVLGTQTQRTLLPRTKKWLWH